MLGAVVKLGVFGELHGPLVIHEYSCCDPRGLRGINVHHLVPLDRRCIVKALYIRRKSFNVAVFDLVEEAAHPENFLGGLCECDILRLRRGKSDYILFSCFPPNSTSAEG